MDLNTEYLRYGGHNQYSAFIAAPAGHSPKPSVLIVQEIWGADDHMEDVSRRFAGGRLCGHGARPIRR